MTALRDTWLTRLRDYSMEPAITLLSLLLIGHITDEESPLRRLLLKGYASREVELLKVLFWVSRLAIMKRAWFRKPFYYLFAHFLGTRGVVCQAGTCGSSATKKLYKWRAINR